NVVERHFVFFGVIFWPQDFHIFLIGMIAFILFVILFTVIYGRIFCGWVCPQTIFMEMVFRKIEYWIEGDWKDQMVLDRQPLNAKKFIKKFTKHVVFFLLSFIISNLFLTYIIGSDSWWKIITDKPENHIGGFTSMIIFTGVFYFVYARFREQICTTVCPYGRLQGVMLDKNSIAVVYDYKRGEGRAKIKKGENRESLGKGDCIDCHHCIHVCPTGIDIRNGIQMECINCTACIDACDDILEKVGLPKGLIRYDSEEGVAKKIPFRWTKRIIGYTVVLVWLLASLVILLVTRADIETSILRTPGMLYQQLANDKYSNLYNVKIVNKTHKDIPVHFKLENIEGTIQSVGKELDVQPKKIAEGAVFIILDKKEIKSIKTKIIVGVYEQGKLIEKVTTTFVGPSN
ncbi:MAG TPA: cytochrome c oxidase accessory protein CcoG, partial [Cytophagaceae bacterium]|nr:cytochrome c oxidase accessory protein CcoG [Cytophagaceae bacterium]